MFHAVVYVLITGAGIKLYMTNGGKSFIFMMLCIFFLFEGEKILRSIFGIKSGANSMADLAASGAIVWGMAKKSKELLKKDSDDIGSEEDKKAAEEAKRRMKNRSNKEKEDNARAIAALEERRENEEDTRSYGEYQGEQNERQGVRSQEYSDQAAMDYITAERMNRKKWYTSALKKGVVVAGKATGVTLSTTRALADGKTNLGEVVGSISAGEAAGKTLVSPIALAIDKVENKVIDSKISREIASGDLNEKLGLDNIRINLNDDVNPEDYEKKLTNRTEAYSKALEEYARRGGGAKGEIAYYDYLEDNLK